MPLVRHSTVSSTTPREIDIPIFPLRWPLLDMWTFGPDEIRRNRQIPARRPPSEIGFFKVPELVGPQTRHHHASIVALTLIPIRPHPEKPPKVCQPSPTAKRRPSLRSFSSQTTNHKSSSGGPVTAKSIRPSENVPPEKCSSHALNCGISRPV